MDNENPKKKKEVEPKANEPMVNTCELIVLKKGIGLDNAKALYGGKVLITNKDGILSGEVIKELTKSEKENLNNLKETK